MAPSPRGVSGVEHVERPRAAPSRAFSTEKNQGQMMNLKSAEGAGEQPQQRDSGAPGAEGAALLSPPYKLLDYIRPTTAKQRTPKHRDFHPPTRLKLQQTSTVWEVPKVQSGLHSPYASWAKGYHPKSKLLEPKIQANRRELEGKLALVAELQAFVDGNEHRHTMEFFRKETRMAAVVARANARTASYQK